VGVESAAELNPRRLVVRGVSSGVVSPPCAGVTTQLLCGEKSLLHLHAVQEPKLGLNHPKPVIGLERLPCLSEERQVSGRKVTVGGRSWSESIPSSWPPRAELATSCRSNSVYSSRDSRIEAIA
jgi:hypothetical protein